MVVLNLVFGYSSISTIWGVISKARVRGFFPRKTPAYDKMRSVGKSVQAVHIFWEKSLVRGKNAALQ